MQVPIYLQEYISPPWPCCVFLYPDYDNSEREQRVQVPNRALASYLARSNLDYDDIYPPEYRKRSMYRKRGNFHDWMAFDFRKSFLKVITHLRYKIAFMFFLHLTGRRSTFVRLKCWFGKFPRAFVRFIEDFSTYSSYWELIIVNIKPPMALQEANKIQDTNELFILSSICG